MKLFELIDALLVAAWYLGWGIAAVGIVLSAILFAANLSLGAGAALTFAAAFLLSVGVTLLLLPKALAKGVLAKTKRRCIVGGIALAAAMAVMGAVYFTVGGFPALNLLFI